MIIIKEELVEGTNHIQLERPIIITDRFHFVYYGLLEIRNRSTNGSKDIACL